MQFTFLGRSGLSVSRLALGTNNFGSFADEDECVAMMDTALERGINLFDTANMYGRREFQGYTEQIVGRWLSQDPGRRNRIVLASKVYGKMGAGENDQRLSAYHIRRACEDSLRRLKTDHIDLYQMHHVDLNTPWEEIWQAMEQLVHEGKVTYFGSSNFAAWHIAQASESAARRHKLGLVSDQSIYSLANRTVELEVLPACMSYGIGVIPYSPLGGGLLAGMLRKADRHRSGEPGVMERLEKHRPQLERWESFCETLGQPPEAVALAWLLIRPAVTAPIIGPRTVNQLTGCMAALEISLDKSVLAELDDIWPGPGGEAPQAYAW
jgi:aryl-alcohol dehydrogenase-like predicted oxidoreductase